MMLHSIWDVEHLKEHHSHSNNKKNIYYKILTFLEPSGYLKLHLKSNERQAPPQKNKTQAFRA